MSRKNLTHISMLCILLAIALGCVKKPPKTTPVAPAVSSVEPEVTPPTAPAADGTPAALPGDLVELNALLVRQGLLGDVLFAFDESTLSAEARQRLVKNAEFFNAHSEYVATVEGHCDERGTSEYNLSLGDRRATAASSYLANLGVASLRLQTVSYGEERPLCATAHEGCWQQNRRAHFLITGRVAEN